MRITQYGPGDEITWGPCTDPRDPRWEEDEDRLTKDDARDQARDELCSQAANVAEWLYTVVDNPAGWEFVDTLRVDAGSLQDAPVHVLFAVIMTGTNEQANLARMFLRERYEAARADQIDDRADEILHEANGQEPDPYANDPHLWF